MKRFLPIFLSLSAFIATATGQNFSGQWKGEFIDKSSKYNDWSGDRCKYVLDLEISGKKVSGFSYTYFTDEGKNFYTICRVDGFVDTRNKYIEVTEVERTKTNVPVTVRNCFQVHKLTYFKQGDTETFEGSWNPAPNQGVGCGYGSTLLSRRSLSNAFPGYNNLAGKSPEQRRSKPITKQVDIDKDKIKKPKIPALARNSLTEQKENTLTPQSMLIEKEEPTEKEIAPAIIRKMPEATLASSSRYEKRNNALIKTIEVESRKIRVDLYDNGEIDGDSISVFHNGKLLLSHKRLSEKPITLMIPVDENDGVHELVMYAENLGSIPPNTALMVITDGDKRHEVRITSDLQKSGTINFIWKGKE